MTHTPGPWRVVDYGDHGTFVLPDQPRIRFTIARVYALSGSEYAPDNAHLVAAAPELLELVNFVLACEGNDYAVDDQWVARAEATIAKAEGRQP